MKKSASKTNAEEVKKQNAQSANGQENYEFASETDAQEVRQQNQQANERKQQASSKNQQR
ncbi:gamma-type small acid-soluble spore protein [Paenalkalicoccus suaedae]|uniref:Small, acid-soluble spore protein gamma-type n=1 Tax=Paenalkalicoccus suaedae TaxID=2592382 RepID=A0A859FCF3_9BACI|nr:gamma-type small acid-soluble spore protein [Paenalkalicoccus suaedae]QKS70620.1 gamma-type small acid-soluble spore protein [Paenalkalicoccus suaedae]